MKRAFWLALTAVGSFHIAWSFPSCALLIVVFLWSLYRLAAVETARQAFYFGLGIGLATFGPHLAFFWNIFQIGAVVLWIILSFWIAMFVVIGRACLRRFGPVAWACAAPFVWTGLEYFRSELYYLRFSWLSVGYVFSNAGIGYFSAFGVYGIGFALMSVVSIWSLATQMKSRWRWAVATAVTLALALFPICWGKKVDVSGRRLKVAGVQFEFSSPAGALEGLQHAAKLHPDAELFVLSEYSFDGPVPELIKRWCRKQGKHLIAGGKERARSGDFYDTAFVIAPNGSNVFQQVKCAPVQLMKDGLPAERQEVWNSPWGKIGICICYDASYTRVVDELARQGAQALIIPTMDVIDWGARQHQLHGRIAPMRAAEYGLPLFRVCSSGISQLVLRDGTVTATAPCPGDGAIIAGEMTLPPEGARMPPDRILAKASVGLTATLAFAMAILSWTKK